MAGDGKGVLENARGAGQILFALATPFLRRQRERRGVSDEELRQVFPGDELVPQPRWQYLHGITVEAPPAMVWPWLAQLGQGRGGFYSYQLLEDLIGCRIQNADAVIPDLQQISVGDAIHVHPKLPPLPVAIVEPGHALVLHTAAELTNESWAFIVKGAGGRTSRLFSRCRVDYEPGWARALAHGPWIAEPIGYVMDLKMLDGIRWRAERAAGQV